MAIINQTNAQADVHGLGDAMNASVNFSGALMEMLATVYSYILMAAIREAIQNACDASRRAGLSFGDGVLVALPTSSNPMITVTDRGSGMTKEFMTSTYLSFGSSTKAGDNGAAGGLGVGRWAAYGYIRECYISTCHESDMVERTYFQFQGPGGTPQVQLASEVPGTVPGTRVCFPIKPNDLEEALRAVAWLKEVMQLTMGDSFSVDTPARLPRVLPEQSGHVFELGEVDPTLHGVRLYPMKGRDLKYSREGLVGGSLLVLTNQDLKVGGLPFHVSKNSAESVFWQGMVVEVPMSMNIPFMPSREEIKYTDEVNEILYRIDAAARKAVLARVHDLYADGSLRSKKRLSDLLGNSEGWHAFSVHARSSGVLFDLLRKATGGSAWRGQVEVPYVPEMVSVRLRYATVKDQTLRYAYGSGGLVSISGQGKDAKPIKILFEADEPLTLVINDLSSGGNSRFRQWLSMRPVSERKFLYFSAEEKVTLAEVEQAVEALNAQFGGELPVMRTSVLPAVARVLVGSKVRSSRGDLSYYCTRQKKQVSEILAFDSPSLDGKRRVWLGKTGSKLSGFSESASIGAMTRHFRGDVLSITLGEVGADRLYLLSAKQEKTLIEALAEAKSSSLWEALPCDVNVDDPDEQAEFETIQALKSWVPYEQCLAEILEKDQVKEVLRGELACSITQSYSFRLICQMLAAKPRLMLTGTKVDDHMRSHVDLLSGSITLLEETAVTAKLNVLCEALNLLGHWLELSVDDPEDRKVMIHSLREFKTAGKFSYDEVYHDTIKKFPLLELASRGMMSEPAAEHLCAAMAKLYG